MNLKTIFNLRKKKMMGVAIKTKIGEAGDVEQWSLNRIYYEKKDKHTPKPVSIFFLGFFACFILFQIWTNPDVMNPQVQEPEQMNLDPFDICMDWTEEKWTDSDFEHRSSWCNENYERFS